MVERELSPIFHFYAILKKKSPDRRISQSETTVRALGV